MNLNFLIPRHFMCLLALAFLFGNAIAQENTGYKTPPQSIQDLVNAPVTPSVYFSKKGDIMLMLERPGYKSLKEVSQPELRIGGIRINPKTNGPSRSSSYSGIKVKDVKSGEEMTVSGLPENAKISGISWSDDEQYLAFGMVGDEGISLWVADLATKTAKQVTDEIINDAYGTAFTWLPDHSLLVKAINPNRGTLPEKPQVPSSPIIQETSGNAAPSRTYQDLLENEYDEQLFAYFMDTQLMIVDLDGSAEPLGKPAMIKSMDVSPDGQYVLVESIQPPFSYLVPAYRFPYHVEAWRIDGSDQVTIAEIPLDEVRPTGFDATVTGPRSITWRRDTPATLYWAEAQDGGDPKVKIEERDIIYTLDAPFTGNKQKLASTSLRYSSIQWSDDDFAVLNERWFDSRQEKRSLINPSLPGQSQKIFIERSYSDIYNDPGDPVMTTNELGEYVLLRNGDKLFMTSEGGSPEGSMPFLSTFDVSSGEQEILWRCQAPFYEQVVKVLDDKGHSFITSKQSTDIQPNYWLVNTRKRIAPIQLTEFEDPYPSLKGIQKELVTYTRNDGLNLSATIYTPADYEPTKDGSLPVLMWAYPREYKSKEVAAQVRGSKYEFTRLYWGTPLYWVTQGYAIMDRTEMPIVGEGDKEPNDFFIEQLVANAEAAIDYIVDRGIGDRDRIAVGGHSYGAFMTANLLSHSNLFAAGIARSGAYNRTLTPFGFQYEQRTYWEAPEVYFNMSPFMHADKVKSPILLIHGEADNNSGTFPIQSERYYNALKGHGATARLVFLPNESHGYAAQESIMHTLYEMNEWLDKWVKNRGK
ncbi:S9 family peptidase [Echinicola soli]|uniref:S9 family peptidase n=1 Tax=Echinicola soli TaxID=2591634 RepID=A0A514CEP3_9BACT|nr:prolyl oligopeptidase family serine peptidase [Echinicola soli]QDH78210.1 S9 family peptidase [Echinicola soli]